MDPAWRSGTVGAWAGLGVDEGHHDVSGSSGGGQALVVVRQAAGVHEGPALPGGLHLTVVAQEPAAPPLTHTDRCEPGSPEHGGSAPAF